MAAKRCAPAGFGRRLQTMAAKRCAPAGSTRRLQTMAAKRSAPTGPRAVFRPWPPNDPLRPAPRVVFRPWPPNDPLGPVPASSSDHGRQTMRSERSTRRLQTMAAKRSAPAGSTRRLQTMAAKRSPRPVRASSSDHAGRTECWGRIAASSSDHGCDTGGPEVLPGFRGSDATRNRPAPGDSDEIPHLPLCSASADCCQLGRSAYRTPWNGHSSSIHCETAEWTRESSGPTSARTQERISASCSPSVAG